MELPVNSSITANSIGEKEIGIKIGSVTSINVNKLPGDNSLYSVNFIFDKPSERYTILVSEDIQSFKTKEGESGPRYNYIDKFGNSLIYVFDDSGELPKDYDKESSRKARVGEIDLTVMFKRIVGYTRLNKEVFYQFDFSNLKNSEITITHPSGFKCSITDKTFLESYKRNGANKICYCVGISSTGYQEVFPGLMLQGFALDNKKNTDSTLDSFKKAITKYNTKSYQASKNKLGLFLPIIAEKYNSDIHGSINTPTAQSTTLIDDLDGAGVSNEDDGLPF